MQGNQRMARQGSCHAAAVNGGMLDVKTLKATDFEGLRTRLRRTA